MHLTLIRASRVPVGAKPMLMARRSRTLRPSHETIFKAGLVRINGAGSSASCPSPAPKSHGLQGP